MQVQLVSSLESGVSGGRKQGPLVIPYMRFSGTEQHHAPAAFGCSAPAIVLLTYQRLQGLQSLQYLVFSLPEKSLCASGVEASSLSQQTHRATAAEPSMHSPLSLCQPSVCTDRTVCAFQSVGLIKFSGGQVPQKSLATVRSGRGPQDYSRIWRLLKRQHVTRLLFIAVKGYIAESGEQKQVEIWRNSCSASLQPFLPPREGTACAAFLPRETH